MGVGSSLDELGSPQGISRLSCPFVFGARCWQICMRKEILHLVTPLPGFSGGFQESPGLCNIMHD